MRICVFGAGGVGGYFGGRLARAGVDVELIARGEHLEALRAGGLRVRGPSGNFRVEVPATDDPGAVGPCDFVLFTVKSYDTATAAARLRPLIDRNTAVVSLQNGIDNEGQLADEVGAEHVMGGVAYIFSTIAEPGVVEYAGGPASLVFGELDDSTSPRGRRLVGACERAGVEATLSRSIHEVLWTKFSFICALSGTTAATQLPVGDVRGVTESRDLFARLVGEVRTVAAAEGMPLPDDLADRHLGLLDDFEPETRSSLYHDLAHGRRMELGALLGAAVDRAERHGLEACAARTVYALLRPWAVRNEPRP